MCVTGKGNTKKGNKSPVAARQKQPIPCNGNSKVTEIGDEKRQLCFRVTGSITDSARYGDVFVYPR